MRQEGRTDRDPFRPGLTSWWLVTCSTGLLQGTKAQIGPDLDEEPEGIAYHLRLQAILGITVKPPTKLPWSCFSCDGGEKGEALVCLHGTVLCQEQQGRGVIFTVCETFTITALQERCMKTVFQAYGGWESEAGLQRCAGVRIRLRWFKLPLNVIIR